jgi:histidine triad (HIT) family protein
MSECVFCAIAAGDADRSVVYEDDQLLVIMDSQPVNPGHALVLPRQHAVHLSDLDGATAAPLFVAALRTAAALRASGIRCEGVNLFVADGEAAGQEVFHVHVHVIPRFRSDSFRVEREGGWQASPRSDLDSAAQRLRAAWSATP